MKNQNLEISKVIHKISKYSLNITKTCYILDCANSLIKAHSVSNNRYLKKIATNGEVLYMSVEESSGGSLGLIPTGKVKATTFPGFCDTHDKYFEPIDNHDYLSCNQEQNFLFAFRAAAREYTIRLGVERMLKDVVDNKYPELKLSNEGKEFIKSYLIGHSVGTRDLTMMRTVLNMNLLRRRYWKLQSEVIELDQEYPIVASSTFKLEEDNKGKIINLIHDLNAKAHPFFFTIIPQNGKTFCIMSWYKSDDSFYGNLHGLNNLPHLEKKIIVSNLLASNVENFAVKPSYWEILPKDTLNNFHKQWGISMDELVTPFIYNKNLSLFI